MAHNMHYVMEKWLVHSLDVLSCDLALTWMVLRVYYSTTPRPSLDELRATVVPLFQAIMEDDEVDGGEELSERTRWSRFQCAALRRLAEEEEKRAEEERVDACAVLAKEEKDTAAASGGTAAASASAATSAASASGGGGGNGLSAVHGNAADKGGVQSSSSSVGDGAAAAAVLASAEAVPSPGGAGGKEGSGEEEGEEGDNREWLGRGNKLESPPPPLVWRGKRPLRRYGWQDHLRVAGRAALESLAVLPFWACKVSAITQCGRVVGLSPYPWAPTGAVGLLKGQACVSALTALVASEGWCRGLFKGAIPLVTIGVSQSLVVAMRRHIRFVRRVELSKFLAQAQPGLSLRRQLKQRGDRFDDDDHNAHHNDSSSKRERNGGGGGRSGGGGGRGGGGRAYRGVRGAGSDPWHYVWELMRVLVRHPFELLGVRLVTSSAPEYSSVFSALRWHASQGDAASLLVGLRQSFFNAMFLPRALHHICLLGMPTLLHTRRMLPSSSTSSQAHSGLGGSVELLSSIVGKEGWIGLLAGARASVDILLPAVASVTAARVLGWLLFGATREQQARAAIRRAYLEERLRHRPFQKRLLAKQKQLERKQKKDMPATTTEELPKGNKAAAGACAVGQPSGGASSPPPASGGGMKRQQQRQQQTGSLSDMSLSSSVSNNAPSTTTHNDKSETGGGGGGCRMHYQLCRQLCK